MGEGFPIDQIHLFDKFTKFQLNIALLNEKFKSNLQSQAAELLYNW